jgi:hypothetical protein
VVSTSQEVDRLRRENEFLWDALANSSDEDMLRMLTEARRRCYELELALLEAVPREGVFWLRKPSADSDEDRD